MPRHPPNSANNGRPGSLAAWNNNVSVYLAICGVCAVMDRDISPFQVHSPVL